MAHLIILITDKNRGPLYAGKLTVEKVFGREQIIADNKIVAHGDSAYITGEPEDFVKLVHDGGDLWTTTNPMLGKWRQYVPGQEERTDEHA